MLILQKNINDAASDEYTQAFLPTASSLEEKAAQALRAGNKDEASNLLCRAAVVYRISRFPYVDITKPDSIKRYAFERQKQAYLKATSLWTQPIREVTVPHTYRAGNDGADIPIYIRTPSAADLTNPVPVVLIMTGLDGYRSDNSQRTHEILSRGWAAVVVEIPGTADCPADPADPASPDRLWNSVLSFLDQQPELNTAKMVVWGLSAGGYYAIRAAHTHRDRLLGAIAHGPGCHYYLDPEWLAKVNDHEYPFEYVLSLRTRRCVRGRTRETDKIG
jgi:acetyl esterase/lipase